MHEAGLGFRDILATLTVNPARKLGRPGGEVRPGMPADLVVLAADPEQDVRALARVALVLRAGEILWAADARPAGGR